MAMRAEEVTQLIINAIPDAHVDIRALVQDGDHYAVRVTSRNFQGLSRLQQHKQVYAALGTKMGNELHALTIETSTDPMSNVDN